jgi:hypothetical protein
MFSIKPIANLHSGTEIRNSATIQFEVINPIATNEVINIIDPAPPKSKMKPLPPEINSFDFPISWSGSDSIGNVDFYTACVSVNNGALTRFIDMSIDTTTFHGDHGNTNSFASIAYDKTGKRELKEPEAETNTLVTIPTSVDSTFSLLLPTEYAIVQNFPNLFNPNTEIQYQIPFVENAKLVIYNYLVQMVRKLVNKTQPPGVHTIR